jgi:hypothetical protein
MIMMRSAGAVGTEVVKKVGIETGVADLATDPTEIETGVESGMGMVDIEVIDEKEGRAATAIVIARTGTDVVREMIWTRLSMA